MPALWKGIEYPMEVGVNDGNFHLAGRNTTAKASTSPVFFESMNRWDVWKVDRDGVACRRRCAPPARNANAGTVASASRRECAARDQPEIRVYAALLLPSCFQMALISFRTNYLYFTTRTGRFPIDY
ncbi:hypothetical protein EVAR_100716_1 [Eumeta japonica]|uniref:Uncharacterized protein n=1 Tax=Eumeta variegata TaxID=151549 RepID=A0A4C1ZVK6_EUMVA|nr:hypothetical protein EVAR_100716_1 [Eumeta japonica]